MLLLNTKTQDPRPKTKICHLNSVTFFHHSHITLSPFTLSPFTSHDSPLTIHNSPNTQHLNPVPSHNSLLTTHPFTTHPSRFTTHDSQLTQNPTPSTQHLLLPQLLIPSHFFNIHTIPVAVAIAFGGIGIIKKQTHIR
jgi:hypothetical protein